MRRSQRFVTTIIERQLAAKTPSMAVKANYTSLASFLSSAPDIVALKRFRELQVKNLLFYQAELSHLAAELTEIEELDASSHPNATGRADYRWKPEMAEEPSTPPSPLTTAHLYAKKMRHIRRTLASYSELDPLDFHEGD